MAREASVDPSRAIMAMARDRLTLIPELARGWGLGDRILVGGTGEQRAVRGVIAA